MTERERRTAALAICAIALAGTIKYAAYPEWRSQRERVLDLHKEVRLLTSDLALVESHDLVVARQDSIRTELDRLSVRMFNGVDLNLIGVEVEDYVRTAVENTPVSLGRLTIAVDTAATAGVHEVRVRLEGLTDYPGAIELLRRLESGMRTMNIVAIDLKRVSEIAEDDGVTELNMVVQLRAFAISPDDDLGLVGKLERLRAVAGGNDTAGSE